MSLLNRLYRIVEVSLRVPPLFVIDELLKVGLGLTNWVEIDAKGVVLSAEVHNGTETTYTFNYGTFYQYLAIYFGRFLLSTLGCAAALCVFMLNTKHLMVVYTYLMSVGVIFVSYWTNLSTMRAITSTGGVSETGTLDPGHVVIANYFFQLLLTFVFVNVYMGPLDPLVPKALTFSFLLPSLFAILPVPANALTHLPVFAVLLPLLLVKLVLWTSLVSIVQTLHGGYQYARNYATNFGMSVLIEAEWFRLSVPEVLRTFWLIRVAENVAIFFSNGNWGIEDDVSPLFRLVKSVLVTGCDTLMAVLGITSVVSYICHHIGSLFHWLMLTEDENDKSIGTVSAILFYILALQTGLTGLEPEKRFVRLCRNFCLLFTALLHFIHNVVNPLLMSLSTSHNLSLKRHLRALLVCAFLILFPITLLAFLWSYHDTSTWLLAVTAFSIEVIVKVCVSLAIYSLFLLDARRETFWERLDDYVYYIRAFGNTVEFCFGIFLFFNGAWILVFESGGAIRAIMMCIHAYFNIWCDAKAGWSVFMKRRTAVSKIDSLPEADAEELRRLEDVCAICYQEMNTAKITRCRHFFHGVCLRKWLYVQDRCPLCHEVLHSVDCADRHEAPNSPQQLVEELDEDDR